MYNSKIYKVFTREEDNYLVCVMDLYTDRRKSQNERLQLAADDSTCITLSDVETIAGWIKVNA